MIENIINFLQMHDFKEQELKQSEEAKTHQEDNK